MADLYDEYTPENPCEMPMNHLYRAASGSLAGRAVMFAGAFPHQKEGRFDLCLIDLLTEQLFRNLATREDLRNYLRIMPADLTPEESAALDLRARQYAEMCVTFAELSQDPDAGKGPEHDRGFEF